MALPLILAGIAAGTSLISSGAQFFSGLSQKRRGRRMIDQAEKMDTTYKTPDEIGELSDDAETQLQGKSAVQKILSGDARRATSRYLKRIKNYATSGAQGLAMAGEATSMEQDSMADAVLAGEADRNIKQTRFDKAQIVEAGYKDKEFEYNKYLPYLQKMTMGQQLAGAGMKNQQGGLGNIGKSVTAGALAIGNAWEGKNEDGNDEQGKYA